MFKVNNGNTRAMCEICLKSTIKTQIIDVVLVSLLLNLEQISHIVSWVICHIRVATLVIFGMLPDQTSLGHQHSFGTQP